MLKINNTYAKIFGLAVVDETGDKDWGYVKISLPNVSIEMLAKLLKVNVDDAQVITEQEYIEAVGDDEND